MKRRTLAVAITGGIASGKSEVASVFSRSGATVINADREARALLTGDRAVRRKVSALLGAESYPRGGKPDRAFIAGRIFSRPALRRRMNAIVHPAVIRVIKKKIAAAKKTGKRRLIVVEAALIYEAGMENLFDAVVVVDAPVETRIARLRRRDGLNRREALARLRAQRPAPRNRAKADIVITNRGDRNALRRAAKFLYRVLSGLAGTA